MRKQCSICRLQVTPSLDGSCPDCGVSLDDAPETVDIHSTSRTSCLKCGSFLLGSEDSCPACGVTLARRSTPVGAVPTSRRPIPPTPVAAPPALTPSNVAPAPVAPAFLSFPSAKIAPAPPATPSKTNTGGVIENMPVGKGLELAEEKKSTTQDWDRKWQRAEAEAKRRARSSSGGRVLLYLFGFVVVLGVAGAIGAQSLGLFGPVATPTAVALASPAASASPLTTVEAAPSPTPGRLLPLMTTEKRIARAEALVKKGKLADAVKEYDLLLEFEPELAEIYFRQASLYTKLKKFGKACVAYRRYLEIEPEGAHAKVANSGAIRCR